MKICIKNTNVYFYVLFEFMRHHDVIIIIVQIQFLTRYDMKGRNLKNQQQQQLSAYLLSLAYNVLLLKKPILSTRFYIYIYMYII